MRDDAKETINFRLGRAQKQAITRMAAEQDKAVGELIREVIEAWVAHQERRAWEAEAHRASLALAQEAKDPGSAESDMLRTLDGNLEEFAREWIWEEED